MTKKIGVFLIIGGGIFFIGQKIGLGKFPGDIRIQKGNFSFYFPITSCIIISLVLTFILSLFFRK